MLFKATLFLFCNLFLHSTEGDIGCKDQTGKYVDWYIIIKLPQVPNHSNPLIREGYGFLYMDVKTPQWVMSETSIADPEQAVGYTIQQLNQTKNVAYIFYNDAHPNKKKEYSSDGHTKGVVGFDHKTGFWLVHSVPHFPEMAKYRYAPNGREYGQSFLCMSLPYKYLNVLGGLFLYNHPSIYESALPQSFSEDNPKVVEVLKGHHVNTPPYNKSSEIFTRSSQRFIAFAKCKNFEADIYADWLAPHFDSSLYTETWQRGQGQPLPPSCRGRLTVLSSQQTANSCI